MLLEQEAFLERSDWAIQQAEVRVADLTAQYQRTVALATKAAARGLDENAFFKELEVLQQRLNAAREDVEQAERFAESKALAWDRLSAAIH